MESQVWNLARSGDSAAIGEVLAATQYLALSGARKRGSVSRRSDPEDAAQAALLAAYQGLSDGKFAEATFAEFRRWLFRRGRDQATQDIRKNLAAKRSSASEGGDVEQIAVPDFTIAVETYEYIAKLLERFEGMDYYAEIIQMLGEGYTRVEIAAKLELTADQVGGRIKRIHLAAHAA